MSKVTVVAAWQQVLVWSGVCLCVSSWRVKKTLVQCLSDLPVFQEHHRVIAAASTLAGYAQLVAKLLQAARAAGDGLANLFVGNAVANTNVHDCSSTFVF